MLRCLMILAFIVATTMLAGCAEESLDAPIPLPDDSGDVTGEAATEPIDTVRPEKWFADKEPQDIDESPSAVDSIWNALLEGTAKAMDESSQQP